MPEFMFRNLSVKLNPAGETHSRGLETERTSTRDCTPWFTYVQCVMACSDNPIRTPGVRQSRYDRWLPRAQHAS